MNPAVKWILISSGLVTLGAPMLGLLGTVIGMMKSFDTLGKDGVADMQGLSSSISQVLISTAGGLMLGAIGLVIFLGTLFFWLATRKSSANAPAGA